MFYRLPPAGNVIRLRTGGGTWPPAGELFLPWRAIFCNSGTAALAAAVMAAVRSKGVRNPQVILPAYGCPDLVSAVLFAGARPVTVDLVPERPWLDLERLTAAIGPDTVAIIAVNLLGIPERLSAIREIAQPAGVLVIEDSAQAIPQEEAGSAWRGDLVVLSFGRGKPLSLLGGGAVLYRDEHLRLLLPSCATERSASRSARVMARLQAAVYNCLSAARCYWLPASLPWLHLGETRFHPLVAVQCMEAARLELLAANLDVFRKRGQRVQGQIAAICGELSQHGAGRVVDLPAACRVSGMQPLLRYPLLLPDELRDGVFRELSRRGLGASTLYPAALPDIPGIATHLAAQYGSSGARELAARLLTLPVHERVRDADIASIRHCLDSGLRMSG